MKVNNPQFLQMPPPPPEPGTSAIHNETYREWYGRLAGRNYIIKTIIFEEINRMLSKKSILFLTLLSWFIISFSILTGNSTDPLEAKNFLNVLYGSTILVSGLGLIPFFALLIALIGGLDLINKDLRENAISLYFCRPITKEDYVISKATALFSILFIASVLPGIVVYFAAGLTSADNVNVISDNLQTLGMVLGAGIIMVLFLTGFVLCLSALFRNTRFALAIGLLFILIVGNIIPVIYTSSNQIGKDILDGVQEIDAGGNATFYWGEPIVLIGTAKPVNAVKEYHWFIQDPFNGTREEITPSQSDSGMRTINPYDQAYTNFVVLSNQIPYMKYTAQLEVIGGVMKKVYYDNFTFNLKLNNVYLLNTTGSGFDGNISHLQFSSTSVFKNETAQPLANGLTLRQYELIEYNSTPIKNLTLRWSSNSWSSFAPSPSYKQFTMVGDYKIYVDMQYRVNDTTVINDTREFNVTVIPEDGSIPDTSAPSVTLNVPESGEIWNYIPVSVNASDASGKVIRYDYRFDMDGDGKVYSSGDSALDVNDNRTLYIVYPKAGTYKINVIVYDDEGMLSSASTSIKITTSLEEILDANPMYAMQDTAYHMGNVTLSTYNNSPSSAWGVALFDMVYIFVPFGIYYYIIRKRGLSE